ncbi:hypothetical protein JCM31739_19020 [Faecalimonas canis]
MGIKKIVYKFLRVFPIKKNRILFFSYYGANYGGSPKYLSEYFEKVNPELEVVWAFTDVKKHKKLENKKLVKYSSIKYYYYLATSHFIITNYRMTLEFDKRKEQRYIQTWHSSLRLKMIEKDAEDTLPKHYVEMAKKDSKQIDLLLAGNKKSKEIYENAFWYMGDYLECGTPQCDLFFQEHNEFYNKVMKGLGLESGKKILLYAPTFRKNHDLSVYNIEYDNLKISLEQKFGGEWMILVRLHPHLLNEVKNLKFNEYIINATSYDDIQELLSVADAVITDYSALMFDYILTKKPCFLYASDYEAYTSTDRKLYFNIKELPFPISFDNKELNCQILDFSVDEYQKNCELFLKENIGSWDDGNACKRVLEYIEGEM